VRLTCILGGLPFSDVRVSFDKWAQLKPQAKFGQLPIMDVDGESFAQSGAMLTYVGKLTNLYPSDPKKAFRVDEVIGLHDDVMGSIRPSILVMRDPKLWKREAARKQAEMRKELAEVKLPEMFAHYEKVLETNGTGYFVGASPTIADVAVFAQLRFITSGILDGIPKTVVEPFPKLNAFYVRVSHLPGIEKYYSEKK
jgi:glutathione S-transferase